MGFRKSGLNPPPGRPRPTGYLPKVPKAQWALRGGLAGFWGCFFNETACRFHSIEAKCGFPRWCGSVWAVRAGQTGPGGDGGPWGSHVSYPSRHGDWWAPEGCFFNETACRFHLIEAKCGFPRWCGYVWAVRAGQTGPGGDGGPWGSHVSYPSRHGRPLRSQVTTGRLNGLYMCVVVQYTPHAGQSVPMLNAPQMNTCGPPAADPTPPGPPGT